MQYPCGQVSPYQRIQQLYEPCEYRQASIKHQLEFDQVRKTLDSSIFRYPDRRQPRVIRSRQRQGTPHERVVSASSKPSRKVDIQLLECPMNTPLQLIQGRIDTYLARQ